MTPEQIQKLQASYSKIKALDIRVLVINRVPTEIIDPYKAEFWPGVSGGNLIEVGEQLVRALGRLEKSNLLPLIANGIYSQDNEMLYSLDGVIDAVSTGYSDGFTKVSQRNRLIELVGFLLRYNFWQEKETATPDSFSSETEVFQSRMQAQLAQLDRVMSGFMGEAEKIESLRVMTNDTASKSEKLLTEIERRHEMIVSLAVQANNISSDARVSMEKISGSVEQAADKVTTATSMIDNVQKLNNEQRFVFEQNMEYLNKTIGEYDNLKKQYDEFTIHLENKVKYFNQRNTALDELIGKEAATQVFLTFKQRKDELAKPVQAWGGAVILTAIGSVAGIWAILHYSLADIPNPDWKILGLTSIKAIPLLILLYFTISQYIKVRHFQEEYAFKSAMALTIDGYSERVKNQDTRDELIMKAVMQLYKSPINNKIKAKESDLMEIVKELTMRKNKEDKIGS